MPDISNPLVIPNRPKPYLMAHRGNRVACPENTLAAFRRALVDGADILETDLHLVLMGKPDSREGVLAFLDKRDPKWTMTLADHWPAWLDDEPIVGPPRSS